MAKKQEDTGIDVMEVKKTFIPFYLLGTTPLICNRMSEKAKRELLMPKGRKTAAEKAGSLKHNPLEEYRASPYKISDPNAPTLIALPGGSFKGAIASAALDMPGAKKAQIGRLVEVSEWNVNVYGVPQLMMAVTRSADMNRTPDIRTRAIIPEWACTVTVGFTTPILRAAPVANLLAAAGITIGVGDWRSEKGKGNFGQFRLVSPDDPQYRYLVENCGRDAQELAMAHPEFYDDETRELMAWFEDESAVRGFSVERSLVDVPPAPAKNGGRKGRKVTA